MSWKDRSQEHEAVMMFCIVVAIIGFLYAVAQLDKVVGQSVNTDTGNIRYHAKRVEEGL